ncbi:MAG: hypothetical protein FJY92_10775 [Candidatus Hydrogenedentes bacterium]|nr:hypothetical protein [Candidatus Hydrogenedentota bacterium]
MTYRGHVENGVIVLDDPAPLKEGERVHVNSIGADTVPSGQTGVPLATRLANVIGKAHGLPEDWAENHDEYLRKSS